jgi:putative flavoprotein involved in K+ transport
LQSVREGVLYFAADLKQSLAYGDAAYEAFLDKVDDYVAQEGLNCPDEPEARARYPDPPCVCVPVRELDMRRAGLGAVIWATGYGFDFSWLELPLLGSRGEPKHERGIAGLPGIYFLGLPWLSKMNSSFLSGVADDAARLADHIERSVRAAAKA